jgi:hypothetical protein
MSIIDSCLPPALLRNRNRIQDSLQAALGALPPGNAASFESDLRRTEQGSVTRWLYFMTCLHAGLVSMNLTDGPSTVLAYGVQLPKSAWPPGFKQIERDFFLGGHHLVLSGWIPDTLADLSEQILDALIVPAENVFLNTQGLREKTLQNVFLSVERDLAPILEAHLQQGTTVTLTHFLFQDLRVYFSLSGEYRSGEIMDSIQKTIAGNLKKTDQIFRLSPLSYLVVCPGAEPEQLKQRFKGIYVQIRTLVLDYELRVHTVRQLPLQLNRVWSELL